METAIKDTSQAQQTQTPANNAPPPGSAEVISPAMLEAEKIVKSSIAKAKADYEQRTRKDQRQETNSQGSEGHEKSAETQKTQATNAAKDEKLKQARVAENATTDKTEASDDLPDDALPEEIRNKSKDTKFHFRRAVQEQVERALKEKAEALEKEAKTKIEELQKQLEHANQVLQEQDQHLKLFVVKKSNDYITAEQKAQEAKKAINELAKRLNIDPKDALSILKEDVVELALAKKEIKKTYAEDGETFVEVAQSFISQYLEAERKKQELMEASDQQAQKLIEERQKREQIERLHKEKERIEAEKMVSQYVTEVIIDTDFAGKDGVDFNSSQIVPEVYQTLRQISTTEDGQEQLELMVSQIVMANSLQRQNQNLLKEIGKLRQMLKTAGVKFADPAQASSQKSTSTDDSEDEVRLPSVSEMNRAIKSRYQDMVFKGI